MAPTDIGRLLGHTSPAKSLPWYLREDKHHLGRVYRKANPLDRYVAAALDVDAQARGEPCVFYYLADGPDGRPRMCGNPHFARCVHQMACIECEAFIHPEMVAAIEMRGGTPTIGGPALLQAYGAPIAPASSAVQARYGPTRSSGRLRSTDIGLFMTSSVRARCLRYVARARRTSSAWSLVSGFSTRPRFAWSEESIEFRSQD